MNDLASIDDPDAELEVSEKDFYRKLKDGNWFTVVESSPNNFPGTDSEEFLLIIDGAIDHTVELYLRGNSVRKWILGWADEADPDLLELMDFIINWKSFVRDQSVKEAYNLIDNLRSMIEG